MVMIHVMLIKLIPQVATLLLKQHESIILPLLTPCRKRLPIRHLQQSSIRDLHFLFFGKTVFTHLRVQTHS